MKTLVSVLAALIVSCCSRDQSKAVAPAGPVRPDTRETPEMTGSLNVTVTRPSGAPLPKAADMAHGRLQIVVSYMDEVVDTSFTLSSSSTLTKLVRNVPVGRDVRITANIFSMDDSLTHTGAAQTDVLAGETTFVEVNTASRFGYLSLVIYDVPSNVDSGYARISGPGMAPLYAPLAVDSLARDSTAEYDGRASALIEYIPVGSNRKIEIFLLKENGQIAYDGNLTMDILTDNNRIGAITLDPAGAKLRVGVVAPDYDTSGIVGSLLSRGKPESGRLVVTEVMYNPDNTDNNEWVEIHNPGASAVDLAQYRLIVMKDTFALSGTLPAGAFFVTGESDSSYIDLKTGIMTIPNSGDSTVLVIDDLVSSDSVSDFLYIRHTDASGWPASSDGVSIALDREYLDAHYNNCGVFWAKSTEAIPGAAQDRGTPGY